MNENSPVITEPRVVEGLKGQRVLLIGGAGFIGHHLALALRRQGVEVMVVDHLGVNHLVTNEFAENRHPIQRAFYRQSLLDRLELLRESGAELENVDARLAEPLSRVFAAFEPTKVVHLAAISSAVYAHQDPGRCFDLQLLTLRNALASCQDHIPRVNQLMLMSSSTIYGDFERPEVDETLQPRPRGIYATAKYMAERLLHTWREMYGLGTTIIRPSALYGERCVSRRVSQIFIENALTGRALRLEGGGEGRLDFTYIDDLVDGLVRALALHQAVEDSNTFNLTYGQARTIRELASVVESLLPGTPVEVAPKAAHRPVRGTLSVDRARAVLGFAPRFDLQAGYRRYCEWYIEAWRRAGGA